MVIRKNYLNRLLEWKDERVVKVVTGIRRCGKSTLLEQYKRLLLDSGISSSQIISVNFEELEYEELLDYRNLYAYLKERLNSKHKNYLFLDEIQRVSSFEKVVDSLYAMAYVDIYIAGSNSYLLSVDLTTLLTGRYMEIKMLPFSFCEFCEAEEKKAIAKTREELLSEYMKVGGLPYVAVMDRTDEKLNIYLEGIYNTVIVRDIEERQSRKEKNAGKRGVTNISLLKNIACFLASVIGSPVSVKSVTDYLISSGRKVSPNTVDDYMDALCESFIFYEARRFDIVGKELLKTNRKMYMVDLGLRNYILPKSAYDLGFSLENVVFFELLRRGYRVNIGNLGTREVDFVARKGDRITYYQVSANLTAKETFQREIKPLSMIKDNYEKIVLTLDRYTPGNYEGIEVLNAIDWLLNE